VSRIAFSAGNLIHTFPTGHAAVEGDQDADLHLAAIKLFAASLNPGTLTLSPRQVF
jgi:hypothetical protein